MEELRFGAIFIMLGIAAAYDLFNERMIPVIVFIPALVISSAFFILEFSYASLLILVFWLAASYICQRSKLWFEADTLALVSIAMAYPYISPHIFILGSAPFLVGSSLYGLYKRRAFMEIMTTKMPFLPALFLGFCLVMGMIYV